MKSCFARKILEALDWRVTYGQSTCYKSKSGVFFRTCAVISPLKCNHGKMITCAGLGWKCTLKHSALRSSGYRSRKLLSKLVTSQPTIWCIIWRHSRCYLLALVSEFRIAFFPLCSIFPCTVVDGQFVYVYGSLHQF